jgi:molybdenum cofactor biosynthesis protein B
MSEQPVASGADIHRAAAGARAVPVAVITVSDTRTPETDDNRAYLSERLQALGHSMVAYRLIRDEPAHILQALDEVVAVQGVRIVLINGGTGISQRDTTYDVVSQLLEKTLPGFGELFRAISFAEIGAAAMLSRATAGVYRRTLVFSMPGSPHAVRTACERLIFPELGHLAWEIVR